MLNTEIAQSKEDEKSNYYIGMGGWDIPSFYEYFYPSKMQKGFHRLEYYSRFFDIVEVNSTFYTSELSPAMAYRWLKDVENNNRFVFAVKLFKGFTHSFTATEKDVNAINSFLKPLRETKKLVGLVIQFPSSYFRTEERQNYIIKLRNTFMDDKVFLDLRHRTWNSEKTYKMCEDYKMNLINVDLPPLPNHMPLNAKTWDGVAYFRMMGRNARDWNNFTNNNRYLYHYSKQELDNLVEKIRQANGKKTYIIFHNDKLASSIANAFELKHRLYPNKQYFVPAKLLIKFPQIKEFCKPIEKKSDNKNDII